MLPLMEMLTQGGNGAAFQAIARQFGVTPEQAEQAAAALMPAFSQGLKRNATDPMGFMAFMNAMAQGNHARFFENPEAAASSEGREEGNAILGHLFGSKEVSRAVAAQAAQMTGLSQGIIKQMLPALAPILLGGLFKQMTGQMTGANQAGAGANPLGQILEQMMGGALGGGRMPQTPGSGANPWGDLLGQVLGGAMGGNRGQVPGNAPQAGSDNPLGDLLGQMMGGGRAGGRDMPAPGADNPLGQIFQDMLRGGLQPGNDQPERQREPEGRRAQPGGSLEDLFGQMFETGRQTQNDYQKGIEQIFDQFMGGKRG